MASLRPEQKTIASLFALRLHGAVCGLASSGLRPAVWDLGAAQRPGMEPPPAPEKPSESARAGTAAAPPPHPVGRGALRAAAPAAPAAAAAPAAPADCCLGALELDVSGARPGRPEPSTCRICAYSLSQLQDPALLPNASSAHFLRVAPSAPAAGSSRVAILRTSWDWAYVRKPLSALMLSNSVAYAERYAYAHYVYICNCQKGWRASKVDGLWNVFAQGHAYALYLDFDAFFEPRLFVQQLPLEPLLAPSKSLFLMAEPELCAGVFAARNSDWTAGFFRAWKAKCAAGQWCDFGKQDQLAYEYLIHEEVHDVCGWVTGGAARLGLQPCSMASASASYCEDAQG